MRHSVDVAWVALSLQPRIGCKTIRALLQHFPDLNTALQADAQALTAIPGIGAKTATAIRQINLEAVRQLITTWQAAGVHIILHDDSLYPPALRLHHDEPPTLFIRGQAAPDLWHKTVAIIGTRRPTQQARAAAANLSIVLAGRGYTVISGLAYGIDAIAHTAALDAEGKTVAVLGGGVLNIYPHAHRPLAQRIMQQGLLICEVAPDAEVNAPRLVSRNRIITALSQHVIVVETGIDGGAMHAARRAQEQNRQLYALDFPQASGNQALLTSGVAQRIPPFLDNIERLFN